MAKTTAHRPSESHRRQVKNSKGDLVRNTAYRAPNSRTATRSSAPAARRDLTADAQAVALCKDFNNNLHGVIAMPGSRSGTVELVQGEYTGTVTPLGEEAIVTAKKGGRVVGTESYPIEMAITAFAYMTRHDK